MVQVHFTLDSETLKGLFTKEGKDQAFVELISSIFNQVLNERENEQAGAVIHIFSNEDSLYRLMGTLLMEIHEPWSTVRKYLDLSKDMDLTQKKATSARVNFVA